MKFDEVLRENRNKIRNRALEQQRLRAKKEKRKDIILCVCLIVGFIISIGLAMKLGQDSMKSCISAGHSKQYCEKGL